MAYADDVLLFLNNKQEWLRIKVILGIYHAASNSKINYNKTTGFPLTNNHNTEMKNALQDSQVQWHDGESPDPLIYLGYPVPICQEHINTYLDILLAKIQSSANILSQRFLSVLGKSVIVNSVILSRLWHALWVVVPPAEWFQKVVRVVKKFVLPNNPAPSWQLMCSPKDKGGLGLINPSTQSSIFQLRHAQNMLSDSPSFGRQILLAATQKYTLAHSPFSAFLNPQCYTKPRPRMVRLSFHHISTIYNVLKAFSNLPNVPWNVHQLGSSMPPAELLLAAPIEWWLEIRSPTSRRFIKAPSKYTYGLWTSEILCIKNGELAPVDPLPVTGPRSAEFKKLDYRVGRKTVRYNTTLMQSNRDTGIAHPTMPLNAIIRAMELPVPGFKRIPFERMSTKQLRLFLFPPAEDRSAAKPKHWLSFWRAKIHPSARNLWWRFLHHALPCAVVRCERWKTEDTPACPDCKAPKEDFLHYMVLCPKKRKAWEDLLAHYTDRISWSDQELEQLLRPDCSSLHGLIPATHKILPHQLVAAALQGIWSYNLQVYLEDTFLPSEAIFNIMATSAKKYCIHNGHIDALKE